jgi:hemerythrin superfamily protein
MNISPDDDNSYSVFLVLFPAASEHTSLIRYIYGVAGILQSRRQRGNSMNAIELIKNDHRKVDGLFSEYLAAEIDDLDQREDLFQQIEKELLAHGDAEEQILYPAIQSEAPDVVEEALSEHQEVKQLLSEMLEYEVDDEEFDKRMTTLIESVQHHVEEEEGPGGILEIAGQRLSAEKLDTMGQRIQQLKEASEDEAAA